MTSSSVTYRFTRESLLMVLGLFFLIFLTACSNSQTSSLQIQQTSAQSIVEEVQAELEIPLSLPLDSRTSDQAVLSEQPPAPKLAPNQEPASSDPCYRLLLLKSPFRFLYQPNNLRQWPRRLLSLRLLQHPTHQLPLQMLRQTRLNPWLKASQRWASKHLILPCKRLMGRWSISLRCVVDR